MRALASGHLRSTRDNTGAWLITPEALDDWLSMRRTDDRSYPDMSADLPEDQAPDLSKRLLEAEMRATSAEAHASGLADRLADTQADRDRWRELAEKVLEARATGFWTRLFGR